MKKTYIIAAMALLTVTIEVAGTAADMGTNTVFSASKLSVDTFMETVHKFADVRMEKGRDRYGDQHSPLFASALDRNSLDLPSNPPNIAGIRYSDRSQWGGNPHHDEKDGRRTDPDGFSWRCHERVRSCSSKLCQK